MKSGRIIFFICFLTSCNRNVMKLAIPTVFQEQATVEHVTGARKNHMSFGEFRTSKIKRGIGIRRLQGSDDFFSENRIFHLAGINKEEFESEEKAKFRFSLSDGRNNLQVVGRETEYRSSVDFEIRNKLLPGLEFLQEYSYTFIAIITADSLAGSKPWNMIMKNTYDRYRDTSKKIFPIIKPDDHGIVTNGEDTIFVRGIALKKIQHTNGREYSFPVKMLGGYELSTADGIVAIVDVIDKNVWFYNHLDRRDKLLIGTIATAIFARRVKATW
jgi:hypothetical protein